MRRRRTRRSQAVIDGARLAKRASADLGAEVRASRRRRRLTQEALADRTGISRQRIGDIEAGRSLSLPSTTWFAIAQALGRYLRFEFARDPLAELVDAGHLSMQELVIRLAKAAGWEAEFESESRARGIGRSIDVRLIDRKARRIVIVECWNTFGDLGAAARSSNDKVEHGREQAVAIAGDGEPFEVRLVWVVRDTKANRELIGRYGELFSARFPGWSQGWADAITRAAALPAQPGLVWCDTKATRLFAWRRSRRAR